MLDTTRQDARGGTVALPSYGQQRMWFFERLAPGSAVYTVQHTETLTGPFDADALQRALDALIHRHDALHASFEARDGRPVQVIHPPAPAELALYDVIGRPHKTRIREVERLVHEMANVSFDLEYGPLMRFAAIEVERNRQVLVMAAHHIVFDLWSIGVFSRDLAALYGAFRAGRPSPLPDLPLRYGEVVAEQRARFDGPSDDPQLLYWREQLRGLPATTEILTDRPRPSVQSYRGAGWSFNLPTAVAGPFRNLVRNANATLFMGLFAAYAVLLHRHSGQTDLAVGTPIANRGRPGVGGMIGLFLNTLVLRVDLSDDPTVTELLGRVRNTASEAFAHQDMPFELLVDELKPARDPSRHPLFQTLFIFQPAGRAAQEVEAEVGEAANKGARFDLTLTLTDTQSRIAGAFNFAADLFAAETIARLAGHYEAVLAAMAADPHARVSRLAIMGPAERRHIVEDWNATDRPVSSGTTLHGLIAEAAAANPSAVALAFEGATLTYRELDRRATALADDLRRRGAGPEVRVGLCAERSLDWGVAIVAVLASGAALVPLDPTFPADRLGFMAGDAGLALILTESGPDAKLARTGIPRLDIHAPVSFHGSPKPAEAGPENLAYVVYTSGSTGRPKGVMVEHGGAVSFVLGMAPVWGIGPDARVLQFTALGFDIGLSEVLLALCSGAALHLARGPAMMPGPPLLATLREERITHVTLPPSGLAAMIPEALPDLRLVVSGGEPCDPVVARRWAPTVPIVNAYGPTEATIYATVGTLNPMTGEFPIGRPIANMRVYVLDAHGAPVPPGVAGEIHIGGIGVARGYLGRPELTAERFVPDTVSGRPGRLYRTGDLGRFDGTGTLHYLGRMDRQLKVRGYRIEPGEVESVLRQHPQVADAVVTGLGTGPEARLIAYIIPKGTPPLAFKLRAFLAGTLPDYMAPAAYITMNEWPKTPNGKIDQAALPRPETLTRETQAAYAEPESDTERRVAAIWRDCLNLKTVGIDDNFFDLGGHSLLLVKVHERLRDELRNDLTLVDLFRYPTVRFLAAALLTHAVERAGPETAALGRVDERAARQNAVRLRRRRLSGAHHA